MTVVIIVSFMNFEHAFHYKKYCTSSYNEGFIDEYGFPLFLHKVWDPDTFLLSYIPMMES